MAALLANSPLPVNDRDFFTRDFKAGRVVHVADTESHPGFPVEWVEVARKRGYRANIGVPMMRDGEFGGVISVTRAQPGPFPDSQVELLQTFADQAVIAIENVRLFNETKEALEQQTASAEVLQVISSSVSDTAPVFEKIMDSCQRLFAADSMGIDLLGEDGLVRLAIDRGPHSEEMRRLPPAPAEKTITGLALRERRVVYLPDMGTALDNPAVRAAYEKGARSYLTTPLLWNERGIGAIYRCV